MSGARKIRRQGGFSVLELLLIVVVIGLLAAVVVSTYAGIRRNQRNQERRRDVQDIYQLLEAYDVENGKYPTLANMNSNTWLTANLKTLNPESLRDPSSKSYALVSAPAKNAYAYVVTATDGSACDDTVKACAHYTITATLEGSNEPPFVKSSLN
jgi:type II secretory pathway pseudopilin PulG